MKGQQQQKKGEESPTGLRSTTDMRPGSESRNNYKEEVPLTSSFNTLLYTTTTPVLSMMNSHTQNHHLRMGFTQPHSHNYNYMYGPNYTQVANIPLNPLLI